MNSLCCAVPVARRAEEGRKKVAISVPIPTGVIYLCCAALVPLRDPIKLLLVT